MRVLMLNYEFPPLGGGAAPVTEKLVKCMVSHGKEVDLVTMNYNGLSKEEEQDGVIIHRVPCLRSQKSICRPHEMLSFLPTGFWKAKNLLKQNNYDIVHTHFIIPTGVVSYFLKKFYGIPYVITIHGSDVPGYNPDRFGSLHSLAQPLWKKIIDNSSGIISPSEYLGGLLKNSYPDADFRVIPNGLDFTQFNPNRNKDERILLTGRLFERKGVSYFLEVFKDVETDWEVVITGEGPVKEKLQDMSKSLDLNVKFPGWVEKNELKELLETSAIYVFPSSYENCPVALQEAMASGCAIIASRYSGTGEVIGDAGIKVDPRDKEEFSREISRLIGNEKLRREIGRKARERVEQRFSWNRIIEEYFEVFNKAAN